METTKRTYDDKGDFTEETRNMPSSIEVTRNAKGDYQWAIKQYGEPEQLHLTVDDIAAIDGRLRARFIPALAKDAPKEG